MFELKGARSARIPAGKLLLWRRRLTGAINRSGPYKISEAVLLVCGEKGVNDATGLQLLLAPYPLPFCLLAEDASAGHSRSVWRRAGTMAEAPGGPIIWSLKLSGLDNREHTAKH